MRTVPDGTRLSIAGVSGVFEVRTTAQIVDDATSVSAAPSGADEVARVLDEDLDGQLWDLVGPPPANASVRRRSTDQNLDVHRVGDVSIDLDTPIEGIIGFLAGILLSLLIPGILPIIFGVIIRNMLRNEIQDAANDVDLGQFDLPIADQLDGLGIYLELSTTIRSISRPMDSW